MPTRTLCILGAIVVLLPGCGDREAARSKSKSRENNPATGPRKVRTARVSEQQIQRSVIALGSLAAYEHSVLSAKVAGRIQSIQVDLGSRVRKGDVIAQIELKDYELKVRQSAAALAQARVVLGLSTDGELDQIEPEKISSVKEAKAVFDESKVHLDRITKLSKQEIIAQSEVDTAQSAYLVALNRYQDAMEKARQLQSMLTQRRVEYDIAKQQLADATLVAPFDGGIQQRLADPGEYLLVGAPVVTLVRLDPLRLKVEAPERDAVKVRLGQTVRFKLEGETNVYKGTVDRLSPALDENTRMLTVESDIKNDGHLRPGFFVRAEILTTEVPVLTIPNNAIITFAGIEKAFTVEQSKAVEKRIVTGSAGPGWIEVISGLKKNDEVILNPGGLQMGNPVQIEATIK